MGSGSGEVLGRRRYKQPHFSINKSCNSMLLTAVTISVGYGTLGVVKRKLYLMRFSRRWWCTCVELCVYQPRVWCVVCGVFISFICFFFCFTTMFMFGFLSFFSFYSTLGGSMFVRVFWRWRDTTSRIGLCKFFSLIFLLSLSMSVASSICEKKSRWWRWWWCLIGVNFKKGQKKRISVSWSKLIIYTESNNRVIGIVVKWRI